MAVKHRLKTTGTSLHQIGKIALVHQTPTFQQANPLGKICFVEAGPPR